MQKFVKKINMFVALLIAAVVLVGCTLPGNGNGTGNQEELKITIEGLQEAYTFNTGDLFNEDILLQGVTVTDQNGKSYIENVEIKGIQAIPLNEDGTLKQAGNHTLRFNVVIDGKTVSTKMITVEVKFVMVESNDIIYNGNFETGTVDPFIVTEVDGGVASIEVVEGQLVFSIESLSWQAAFPRLDYGKLDHESRFTLEDGKYYEVSFDAKSSVARHIHVQVGQLFAEAPWFADALSVQQYILLSTEMESYSFRFQADASRADLTALSLLFGHGTLPDGYISEQCDIIYDNIKIVEVDSLGADTMAPTITSTGITKYYVGEAFDAAACVVVSDDQDKAPVLEVVEAESTLPAVDAEGKLTTAGEYTIVYVARDVAGNESAKFTLNITVAQPASAGSELIKNNDFADTTPTADGITDWIIFADSGNTLAGNAANGVMTLTVNNAASAANWNPQFKQAGLEIKEGNVYKLTVTLESTVARTVQVAIQNDQWWNMHLEQFVELAANTPVTVEYEFTAVAPSPNVIFFLGLGAIDGQTVAEVHNIKVSGLSLVQTSGSVEPDPKPEPDPDPEKIEIPAEGLLETDLSKWIAWADGGQSISANVVEGKLVLTLNSTGSGVNYNPQFKLEGLSIKGGKSYVVEIVLTSSISRAVQVMLQENGGGWAVIANPIEQVEAGVEKTITLEVTAGSAYSNAIFGLMLGALEGQATPEGEHTITISKLSLVEKEDEGGNDDTPVIPEDGNLFVAPETSVIDGEANIYNNLNTWVVWHRDWDPVVTISHSVENGNLHYSGNIPAGVDWWSAQVFYRPSTIGSETKYVLKMNVTANAAMNITVNGKVVELVAGENKVEIEYTIGNSAISIQLGVDGVGSYVGDFDLVFADVEIRVKKAEDTPVVNEYFDVVANTTAGAANNFTIKWKDAAYKVTKEPTKADCGVSVGIVANYEFLALNDELVQVNIITGAEPARNVSIVLHTEAGDYKVTMIIEGGAYVRSTVEKVDCAHSGSSEGGDVVVDNGNLEVLGAFFYAGNHCEFHFKVADVLFDSSYTFTVTCEDYPTGRVVNQFAFGTDGMAFQFFIDGSTVAGKTYVFNITVANGDTVLASGQIAVVA